MAGKLPRPHLAETPKKIAAGADEIEVAVIVPGIVTIIVKVAPEEGLIASVDGLVVTKATTAMEAAVEACEWEVKTNDLVVELEIIPFDSNFIQTCMMSYVVLVSFSLLDSAFLSLCFLFFIFSTLCIYWTVFLHFPLNTFLDSFRLAESICISFFFFLLMDRSISEGPGCT